MSAGGVFISGFGSGAGKSTTALCLLHFLQSEKIFKAEELAYIKPCTQCEAVTDVAEYCRAVGIDCVGVGPVVYRPGFTTEVITAENSEEVRKKLLEDACAAVEELRNKQGKKFVIVDGVGYPSVGSCCGVSNADVAAKLQLPVLLIAPKGVGDALDTLTLMRCYFQSYGCNVQGVLFNRCVDTARHKVKDSIPVVTRAIEQAAQHPVNHNQPPLHVVGFIPDLTAEKEVPLPAFNPEVNLLGSYTDEKYENFERFERLAKNFKDNVNVERLKAACNIGK